MAFEPMLCRTADALPAAPGWLYEPKLDGFRALVTRNGDAVEVRGRGGGRLTDRFPEVCDGARSLGAARIVLDGEIVAVTADGLDFDALLARYDAARGADGVAIGFVAFDVLSLDGADVSRRPLSERRALLESELGAAGAVRAGVQSADVDVARAWLEEFAASGVEGVVCKRARDPYAPGRRGWVKVKLSRTLDAVVGGVSGSMQGPHGLLLGVYDGDGSLRYIGRAGVPPALRAQVFSSLRPAGASPFSSRRAPGRGRFERGGSPWVPVVAEQVVEVAYTAVTSGMLRHSARVLRVRDDKRPDECGAEQVAAR